MLLEIKQFAMLLFAYKHACNLVLEGRPFQSDSTSMIKVAHLPASESGSKDGAMVTALASHW